MLQPLQAITVFCLPFVTIVNFFPKPRTFCFTR